MLGRVCHRWGNFGPRTLYPSPRTGSGPTVSSGSGIEYLRALLRISSGLCIESISGLSSGWKFRHALCTRSPVFVPRSVGSNTPAQWTTPHWPQNSSSKWLHNTSSKTLPLLLLLLLPRLQPWTWLYMTCKASSRQSAQKHSRPCNPQKTPRLCCQSTFVACRNLGSLTAKRLVESSETGSATLPTSSSCKV